jgi:hypothetical protein
LHTIGPCLPHLTGFHRFGPAARSISFHRASSITMEHAR